MRTLVVGGGTMGRGIAQLLAQHGHHVRLADADEALTAAALEAVTESLARAVERGHLTADEAEASRNMIAADDASPVEFALEAVPEDLALKRPVLEDLERRLPASATIASNTSSLSIDMLAEGLSHPDRLVGMHFFNPPVAMPLVEIVRGSATSEEVIEGARMLAVALGKEPIVVRDSPGFATSRLGILLGLEAARMLEEGVASAADIDRAMELGYGHPMGPLRLGDLVGLDVRLAISEHLERELGPRFAAPAILRGLVAAGHLGKKSGRGFYDWG